MGREARSDDNEAMSLRLTLAAALAALVSLSMTSSALAIGLQDQRVASHPKAVSQPSRAMTANTLIAPPAACPGQNDLAAQAEAQEQAMTCMTDFARQQAGLGNLTLTDSLAQSAEDKSDDILRCNSFSHFACGREFTYWMKETGYTAVPCWRVGENLAWGTEERGTVRSIFEAWMRSPGHRENILGDFAEIGISVRVGSLNGATGTRVWAQHLGSRCDEQ
jgi:uncharacterized protein YkwD